MGRSGAEQSEVEWNGVGRSRMEWRGVKKNRVGGEKRQGQYSTTEDSTGEKRWAEESMDE